MDHWYIFQIILVIGAVQGIVLGVYLWSSKASRRLANRFLAAILFFFAYRLLVEVFRSLGIIGVSSWTYHVFLEFNWVYGALIFFYVRSFLDPDAKFLLKRDWIHFIPVMLEIMISIFVKSQNFYWDGTPESISKLGYHTYIFWMHKPYQLLIFAGLIVYYVLRSRKLVNHYTEMMTKPVESEEIQWLDLLLKAYFIFSILVMIVVLVDYLFYDYAFNPFYLFPVYIAMAFLTYWLGLQGFGRRKTPHLQRKKNAHRENDYMFSDQIDRLQKAMEEENLYTNSKLTLQELAKSIDLQPHQLTKVLNQGIKKSFSEFVSQYRVEHAIRLINSESYQQYTLLAIAYESGFNSKASFNRVVKKVTGKSPRELRLN